MWIWQHFYIQHWRKLCFYAEKLFNKKQLMNMMICSSRGAIRLFVWIESWIDGWMWGVLHSGTFSWRLAYFTIRAKTQMAELTPSGCLNHDKSLGTSALLNGVSLHYFSNVRLNTNAANTFDSCTLWRFLSLRLANE